MYITLSEMNTVIDEYKLREMTDNTEEISMQCLIAAQGRVAAYLRRRFDTDKLFAARENERDPALVEIVKNVALYLLVRRHNIDILYSAVKETYDRDLEYLKAIAEGKLDPAYPPAPAPAAGAAQRGLAAGSRPKFQHDYE